MSVELIVVSVPMVPTPSLPKAAKKGDYVGLDTGL